MAARPLRIVVLVIVAFAAGLLLARLLAPGRAAPPATEVRRCCPARALPTLDLVDQDGRPLAAFFAGHWTLVFFGFTQCPDICPTTLATLAQAERAARRPAGGFPAARVARERRPRARPARALAPYVRFFDPRSSPRPARSRRRPPRLPHSACPTPRCRCPTAATRSTTVGHVPGRADRRHGRLLLGAARRGPDRARLPQHRRMDGGAAMTVRPTMPAPPTAPSPCCRNCCRST